MKELKVYIEELKKENENLAKELESEEIKKSQYKSFARKTKYNTNLKVIARLTDIVK